MRSFNLPNFFNLGFFCFWQDLVEKRKQIFYGHDSKEGILMKKGKIFAANAVFVSNQSNQDDLLKEIYDQLLKAGYVKGNFLTHIVRREHLYPTGLDTSTLGHNLPNIAIPHTEGEFVNTRLIVPVALNKPVAFGNMIKPAQKIPVKFLFMLLETNPDGQAKLLSLVMDFLAQTPVDKLRSFLNMTDAQAIFTYLTAHFKETKSK